MRYRFFWILAALVAPATAALPAAAQTPTEDPTPASPADEETILGAPSAFDLTRDEKELIWLEADTDWPALESGFGKWLRSSAPLKGPKTRASPP